MVHRSLIDDAFITLAYARTLAFHFHWGLVPQEPANSATSPLNVILLGAATALTRRPVWAVGIVYVVSNVGLAWWLTKTALSLRLPVLAPVLVVTLVLLNPFVLSAVGMETRPLRWRCCRACSTTRFPAGPWPLASWPGSPS